MFDAYSSLNSEPMLARAARGFQYCDDVYGSLGSSQDSKCASSAILGKDFLTSSPPSYLGQAPSSGEKKFPTALVVGGLIVGGALLYYATQVGGSLAVNPKKRAKTPEPSTEEVRLDALAPALLRLTPVEDVSPLIKGAAVFVVETDHAQRMTTRMVAQVLGGDPIIVDGSISYMGLVNTAKEQPGRPIIVTDGQRMSAGTVKALGEVKSPVFVVGATSSETWGAPFDSIGRLNVLLDATKALWGAPLLVVVNKRWHQGQAKYVHDNPASHRQSLGRVLSRAGWSSDLAWQEMQALGYARLDGDTLYVLTDGSGDAPPKNPRAEVFVGRYWRDKDGDWGYVGGDYFDDLRSALSGWRRDNPGRAQLEGFTRADADAEQLRRGVKHELEHTGSRKVAERIALDHLAEDDRYYSHLERMEADVAEAAPLSEWDWWRGTRPYDNPKSESKYVISFQTRRGSGQPGPWTVPDGDFATFEEAQDIARNTLARSTAFLTYRITEEPRRDNPWSKASCEKDCRGTYEKFNKPRYLKKCLAGCRGTVLGKGLADLPKGA